MIRKTLPLVVVAVFVELAGCSLSTLKTMSNVASSTGKALKTADEVAGKASDVTLEAAELACPAVVNGDFGKLTLEGSPTVQAETRAFLGAAHNLVAYGKWLNRAARGGCEGVGTTLGMNKQQFQAQEQGKFGGVSEICGAAATQLAKSGAKVGLSYRAPSCVVPLDEAQACLAACGATLSGPALAASCQGGRLSGTCDGSCKGACDGTVSATCRGTCDAACTGACDAGFHGTCGGKCTGTCDDVAVQGSCAGTCDGACDGSGSGTCTGTCAGSCAGQCSGDVASSCSGKCSGECAGTLRGASCDGKFEPPKGDSSCYAACVAQAASGWKCGPASVDITLAGGNPHWEKGLKGNFAALAQVASEGPTLGVKQVEALIATGGKLKSDLGSIGGQGLVCVTSALTLMATTSVSMGHSIEATAQFKGSVSGNFGL